MKLMNIFGRKQGYEASEESEVETVIESNALVPFSKKERHRFAEYLLKKRLVPAEVVDAALQEQRVTGDLIGSILVRSGFMRQEVLVPTILEFNTSRIATEQVDECPIDVDILERYGIIVSAVTKDTVFVGTMSDEHVVAPIIKDYYPGKTPRFVAFLPERLPDFLDRMRRSQTFMEEGDEGIRDDEMLDRLLANAIKLGASDVHIEPRPHSYSVFFRVLGVRRLVREGTLDEYNTIVAQLKDRGRMDLAERRIGQDGGFQIERAGRFIDLRAVTVPTQEGEQAIIRILDPDRVNPVLEELGITRVEHWLRGIDRRDGLCLICGATGSGKTTTLNATIRRLNRFERKIYTVEDPVEYRIPYVAQVSANPQVGLDYSRAVKNFMRADPDVIVIGEIRDAETARNAIKAADTGHLVLGTLHTSSIVSSLSRLRDLEVDPHELRYILRAILVQALVRTRCGHCHGTAHVDGDLCPVCKGQGYDSRTVVSECMSFGKPDEVDQILAMMDRNAKVGGKMPWPEMIDDAIGKMVDGVTDAEEMKKVFGSQASERAEEMGVDIDAYRSRPQGDYISDTEPVMEEEGR